MPVFSDHLGHPSLIKVPNKLEESLRRIFDLLKLESNRRLAIKFVGEERFVILKILKLKVLSTLHRYISLSNENFQSVLPFATMWSKLDFHTPSSAKYNILTNSFYSNVVHRYVSPGTILNFDFRNTGLVTVRG